MGWVDIELCTMPWRFLLQPCRVKWKMEKYMKLTRDQSVDRCHPCLLSFQVFHSLLKAHAVEAKAVVRQALEILTPAMPGRMEDGNVCIV